MTEGGHTVFLAGPTASGKSALALSLAGMINAEIVGADAYQIYRGMRVLTASPVLECNRCGIPMHMIDFLPSSENWDASSHYHTASRIIGEIHRRGRNALVVGGSGLYLKFLTHGISEAPPADSVLRQSFANRELPDLADELKRRDPEGAAVTDLCNRRYVERNLEIVITGGKPLSHWRKNWLRPPHGPGFVLEWDVAELDQRIAARADSMVREGVLDEVAALGECSATAGKTLGLSQVRSCLAGEIDQEALVKSLALVTRQYAKRQRTWLRRETWLYKLPVTSLSSSYGLASQVKEVLSAALRRDIHHNL